MIKTINTSIILTFITILGMHYKQIEARGSLCCNFYLLFLRLAKFVNIKTILQTIQALKEVKNLRLFSWNLDLIAIFALLHVYRLKMKIYVSIDTHLSPLWEQWNKCHRKWHTMSLSAHKLVSIFFLGFIIRMSLWNEIFVDIWM